jgi:hypothetical protein
VSTLVVSSNLSEKYKDVLTGKYIWVQTVGINNVREIGRKGNERIRRVVKVGEKENEGYNYWWEWKTKGYLLLLQSLWV